jgi:3-deoxy-D-manno-octulosonic-acid transferase
MNLIAKLKGLGSFLNEAIRLSLEPCIYNTAIAFYDFGVRIAAQFNGKAKKMIAGHSEVFDKLRSSINPNASYIWIHAASLGEFEQGRPIIEMIRREMPEKKVLLTFFSPSGYEIRKDYSGADCVCYLPFDLPTNAKKFIEIVRPEKAIFVKYEIWRNYLYALHHRNIPTYLVSAAFRPEQAFFRRYGIWYRYWLRWFTHIFVQDERSKLLLQEIKINNVTIAGDTRFDRVTDIMRTRRKIPEVEKFISPDSNEIRPQLTFIAGSSWEPDENVYIPWINNHPDVKAIIAPHEFDDKRLQLLKNRCKNGAVLLSEVKEDMTILRNNPQTLIIDCFGLLSSIYAYGDIAYIGGGFGVGIHNINEAAVYGIPVIFGPNHSKFIEANEIRVLGGGLSVDSEQSFSHIADRLLYDKREREHRGKWAGEYIAEKIGATPLIFSHIFPEKN